jgi:transketolase
MRQQALRSVYELAKSNPKVLFIGSDLGAGTLSDMKKELPAQFFMEGISEQHIIGFAAGLAKEGFLPYVNTIATFFARRAYEQISLDIGLHCLPVRLLASGGGMVYAPLGPTHTAIEDLSLIMNIPNFKVFAPADANEMKLLIHASAQDDSPYYIRFGKGGERIVTEEYESFDYMPKIWGNSQSEAIIFTTGILLQHCLDARKKLDELGISCSVVHFPYLSNLNLESIKELFNEKTIILCAEEHVPKGALLTAILHGFMQIKFNISNLHAISLPASFSHKYGNQNDHLEINGLTGSKIALKLQFLLGKPPKSKL